MKAYLTKKNIFLFFCFLIFVIGLCGSFSEAFQTYFISRDMTGLVEIAVVSEREGALRRKLVNDVIWFGMNSHEKIYLGDSLATGVDATTQIQFNQIAKSKLKIGPNTMIRMRLMMKKPLITLLQGGIEMSGDQTDTMFVSSGVKVQKVQIKKETLTKVRRTDDGDLEIRVERTDVKNEMGRTDVGQSKDQWVNTKENEESAPQWIPRPLQYPYPADQTAFLYIKVGKPVALFPKEKCESLCRLKVYFENTEVQNKEFKADDDVFALVPYKSETNGTFRWTIDDGGQLISGVFYVKPYSDADLKTQMKLGHPTEIVGGE